MEKWQEQLLAISESISNMMISINNALSDFAKSETFRSLVEFFSNLPDDIQDTELFQHISRFEKSEIQYDDALWLQDVLGELTYDMSINELEKKENKSKLDKYVLEVIKNNSMGEREKVVVLLAHFEELVYQTITYQRQSRDRVKRIVSNDAKGSHEMEMESYTKVLLAGIVYIVFSNTDNYKKSIDKRIPFRNNIMHRGTMEYSDSEIKEVYELLVYFISEFAIMGR